MLIPETNDMDKYLEMTDIIDFDMILSKLLQRGSNRKSPGRQVSLARLTFRSPEA